MKALKAVRDSLQVKEEVVEDFAALLDGALSTYSGRKREFALSLRGKIGAAIGEALGAPMAPYHTEGHGRRNRLNYTEPTPPSSLGTSRASSRSSFRRPAH